VVTAALLAGLVGGVGGAAGWNAIDDPAGAGGTTTSDTLRAADPAESSDSAGGSAPGPGQDIEDVAAAVLPAVVKISTRTAQGAGSGSGVVLSSDGQILTNEHVVAESVGDLVVSFTDGTTAPAEILGTDPLTDLAVIQARGVSGLTTASLGSSDDVKVGQEVVAVGSPFGLESTVTSGIVSALDRPVDTGRTSDGRPAVFPAIQTDAAINPGNSGGALVNIDGEVVGINAAIRTAGSSMASAGSIGLGFAIPVDQARPIVEQLAAGEPATHALIGVNVSDAVASSGAVTTGALVEGVIAGSAAADAGLAEGDVITAVEGEPISDADALIATVRKYRPDDEVTITYLRGDTTDEVAVTLDSDEGTPTT
jgi:putative serine protease PepD